MGVVRCAFWLNVDVVGEFCQTLHLLIKYVKIKIGRWVEINGSINKTHLKKELANKLCQHISSNIETTDKKI